MIRDIVLILVVACSATVAADETTFTLPSGRTMSLGGSWTRTDKLWPDTALVFEGGVLDGGICVIFGGESKRRVVYRQPWGGRDGNTKGFVFSDDGSTCFAWLHNAMQLTAIDMKNGSMEPLLKLPTHVWNYEGLKHVDPHPVVKPHLLFQDGSNLLLLLQEESNKSVAFWQRRRGRGGHWLVSIPQDRVTHLDLKGASRWPGGTWRWDLARTRKEIYLLGGLSHDQGFGNLLVRRMDGTVVDKFKQRTQIRFTEIALSPNETWLMAEHGDWEERPQDAQTPSTVVRRGSLSSVNETLAPAGRSIFLLSLVSDEVIEIAGDAYRCSWAPDSQSVTYLRDWELWRLNLSDLKEERIAWRQPSRQGRPIYSEGPIWSPDGKRLFVCIGEDSGSNIPMLLLDFSRREFMITLEMLDDGVWAPVPRPFAQR